VISLGYAIIGSPDYTTSFVGDFCFQMRRNINPNVLADAILGDGLFGRFVLKGY
jgi:hypothetical protein